MTTGRAETAVRPGRAGQGGHLIERHVFHALDHELRDPVAAPERDRANRIAKLVVQRVEQVTFCEVAALPGSARAEGGFGSTGGHAGGLPAGAVTGG